MSGASMSPAQALASAVRRNGHLVPGATALTPFDEMAAREASEHTEEERKIREEAVSDWLNWTFEGGMSEPEDIVRVVKRLLSYARNFRSDLVINMSADQIAALLGLGRAAEVARANQAFDETMRAAGYRYVDRPTNKSRSARAKMAKAQKGNQTRARSVKKSFL